MREIQIHARAADVDRVREVARDHDAAALIVADARRGDETGWSIVHLNVPNERVGAFLDAVSRVLEDATAVLTPRASLPLRLPLDDIGDQIRDVGRLSTLELVLSSLQSLGSWPTMLLYASFSGVVAAYGMVLNATYVLVAAMLIAPMGAPAIVAVIAAAIGDTRMLLRGVARFWTGIFVLALTAFLLGAAYRLDVSTALMEQVSSLSLLTALAALIGGAAGALAQVQAERDNLVTGTATGFLIAVSLSPPAAVLGLSVWIGRWDYVGLMAFLLVLTFIAILTGGWAVLRLLGVKPGDAAAGRGRSGAGRRIAATAGLAAVALVTWQATAAPRFQKADRARDAVSLAQRAVTGLPNVSLVEATAHFTRSDRRGRQSEGLLVDVVVEPTRSAEPRDTISARVARVVRDRIGGRLPGVVPYVRVAVLEGSAGPGR